MLRAVLNWIDERTGLFSTIRHFLDEDIPASSGWAQVFGSVALFAFLMQVFSGLLMAVNYAPTPGEAWDSLRYIVTQVTAGSIIRAMHHWGASAMIVVVVLHMIQVFIYGAYKKPREGTWLLGIGLLMLTLAFGLSGYLLAWDNRAYWGTVVTTQIASLAPFGHLILRVLGSDGNSIGRVTFARFYAAHVTLFPLLTAILILFHVALVRKHGVTPQPGDENRPKKKFFPEQVFKDTVATFVWFAVLACLVAFAKVPLGHQADPTDINFIPRPEWYFLFLFQFLKLFQGPLEVVGAVFLPGLSIALLAAMPFIDRGKARRIRQRTGATLAVALAVISWSGLTARAVATTPNQPEEDGLAEAQTWPLIPPSQLAAIGVFRQAKCGTCHAFGKASAGPDLTQAPSSKSADWLMNHFRKPAADDAAMPLTDAQMKELVQLVTKRDDNGVDAWQNAPDSAIKGAEVYQANGCGGCHTVNGEGAMVGPALNGLSERHDRTWVDAHFKDPAKLSPGSFMPAYDQLGAQDLKALTDYVMAIPK
jgi:ubiquinol-cytochrome c reductase cytochrome b subunit